MFNPLQIVLQNVITCPTPPYYPNGSWCGWVSQINTVNNATDPISGIFGTAFHAVPVIIPIFLGALYVFLWVRFSASPARFKFVGIAIPVMIISLIFSIGGFYAGALLNILAFVVAYVMSFIFRK